jgi:hypothetical protein
MSTRVVSASLGRIAGAIVIASANVVAMIGAVLVGLGILACRSFVRRSGEFGSSAPAARAAAAFHASAPR